MAAYNPRDSWQYRNQNYNEDSDSDDDVNSSDNDPYSSEEENKIVDEVIINHLPEKWSDMDFDEVKTIKLHHKSQEFQDVREKIQSTLNVFIYKVMRVQNPYLWGSYLLMKGEYKKRLNKSPRELLLFHATSQKNVESIVQDNFDWRCTKRSKFGKGVSFSPSAKYANTYCNSNAGNKRALILTKVLVGKCHPGEHWMKVPSDDRDTTLGNGNRVYVKYGDNEFYPQYVAYYKWYD